MVGLTPRGERMPQTMEVYQYLYQQYEKVMLAHTAEISKLKQQLNKANAKLVVARNALIKIRGGE